MTQGGPFALGSRGELGSRESAEPRSPWNLRDKCGQARVLKDAYVSRCGGFCGLTCFGVWVCQIEIWQFQLNNAGRCPLLLFQEYLKIIHGGRATAIWWKEPKRS